MQIGTVLLESPGDLHLSPHHLLAVRPPVRSTRDVQRRHLLARWFHVGGEPGIGRHARESACEPLFVPHRRHREGISLDGRFQEHLREGDVSLAHRLADPAPMRRHAGTHQFPQRLDVTLSQRFRQNGGRVVFVARTLALPPTGIHARAARACQSVRGTRRMIERGGRQFLSAGRANLAGHHLKNCSGPSLVGYSVHAARDRCPIRRSLHRMPSSTTRVPADLGLLLAVAGKTIRRSR